MSENNRNEVFFPPVVLTEEEMATIIVDSGMDIILLIEAIDWEVGDCALTTKIYEWAKQEVREACNQLDPRPTEEGSPQKANT